MICVSMALCITFLLIHPRDGDIYIQQGKKYERLNVGNIYIGKYKRLHGESIYIIQTWNKNSYLHLKNPDN